MSYSPPTGTVNLNLTGTYSPPTGTVNLSLGDALANLFIGAVTATAVYIGSTLCRAVYIGSTLVWGSA